MKLYLLLLPILILSSLTLLANETSARKNILNEISITEIKSVVIHPPFSKTYQCVEHWLGQFKDYGDSLGDRLGADCVIHNFPENGERIFLKTFKNSGYKNEDWYGWKEQVLSPCICEVIEISINDVTNEPGIMGKGRASSIEFKTADGTFIVLAHLDDIKVKKGDFVNYGQYVAKVGNNGYSRSPHVHIAAWKDKIPLQLRFDQRYIR